MNGIDTPDSKVVLFSRKWDCFLELLLPYLIEKFRRVTKKTPVTVQKTLSV